MNSRTINYILILAGGLVAIYAEAGEEQNTYLLMGGIIALMLGLYRLSRGISGNKPPDSFVKTEHDEEE